MSGETDRSPVARPSHDDCANSDREDPKRSDELIHCVSLGCRAKVLHFVMCCLVPYYAFNLADVVP